MQPLSVHTVSPEIQFMESRRLIPPSQGLLATTDTSHTIHSAPVLLPFNDGVQSDPAPQVLGLKLLQLHRPPLPQQSAPHHAQGPQALHTANPATIESHQLKNNNQSASVPKRQLSFNPPHDPAPRNSQVKGQTSERSRGQGFSLLPPALPTPHTDTGPSSAALSACSKQQHHVPQTTLTSFLQARCCHRSSDGTCTYDQASTYRFWTTDGKQYFHYFKIFLN